MVLCTEPLRCGTPVFDRRRDHVQYLRPCRTTFVGAIFVGNTGDPIFSALRFCLCVLRLFARIVE